MIGDAPHPKAAPNVWPYPGHGTMADVMRAEEPEKFILADTAFAFGVTPEALLSRKRTDDLAHARWAAMLVFRRRGYSFPQIARMTGRKNHTTIMHGIAMAEEIITTNPKFWAAVKFIERRAA